MKQKIRVRKADGSTEEIDPDIPFLKSIEEQIAIIGPAAEQFRKDISSALMRAMRGGGDQRSNLEQAPQLERAIGLYLQNTVRDICRILAKTDPVDTEGRDKKAKWVGRIQELGYLDPDAVLTVLRYVSHNIWKD
jgi:serine protein kinase